MCGQTGVPIEEPSKDAAQIAVMLKASCFTFLLHPISLD